jgi:hypothetical protein
MGKKVFISHATVDRKMIDILIKFLNNIGIDNVDIFCTSISGTLEGGIHFVKQIKDNVKGSKIVIFLLTERFFLSNFCLAELGAAWALNQKILPIIVPPISTVEYNNTPLLGIQALNMGNKDFTNEFVNDLVRKDVIQDASTVAIQQAMKDFGLEINNELKILRKDSHGFYVARLSDSQLRQTKRPINQPLVDQILLGDRFLFGNETLWKLNGLLEEETDSRITEHWVAVQDVKLSGTKLKFEIEKVVDQTANQKLFSIRQFFELT